MGPRGPARYRQGGLGPHVSGPWKGLPLLIDKSAWERQGHPAVAVRGRAALEADALLSCAVTDYELLFSARDPDSFDAIEARLARSRVSAISPPLRLCAAAAA